MHEGIYYIPGLVTGLLTEFKVPTCRGHGMESQSN